MMRQVLDGTLVLHVVANVMSNDLFDGHVRSPLSAGLGPDSEAVAADVTTYGEDGASTTLL